ncbi:MAG: CPBP family glutamic-type intramembrane protease [Solirubrobacteraceae bacterium]|nr:CPBP family glutamic-type intramembrane protease [Solirubrobacteraceae bacterium]
MSNAETGSGPGSSGDDGTPPVWGDVTSQQPERDVPPPTETHPVPPPASADGSPATPQPGAEIPPPASVPTPPAGEAPGAWNTTPQAPEQPAPAPQPTFGQQLHQPGGVHQPQQASVAPGQAPYGQPPAQPAGQYQAAPGGPIFVNPDQQQAAAGAAPQFVKHDGTAVGQGPQVGDVFSQNGRQQPGGPIFVAPGGQPIGGAQGVPGGPMFVQAPKGPSPVDVDRPWAWWLGPVAFLVAIFGIVPAQLALAGAIAAASGESGSMTTIVDDYAAWFGVLQDVCWIGIVLLLPYLIVKHLRPEQLGIRKAPIGRALLVAGGAVVSFFVFAAIYSAALGLKDTDNTMLQDTGFGDGVGKDIVFALLFTVAAPVAEELLFRGLLFRTLRDGLSSKWGARGGLAGGAIISGLIFGGVHLGGGQDDFLPVLMLLGIVLALAYHWSGSIYVPIAIHAANNALATGANSDPAADWIYGLIAAGPLIALGVTYLLGRFISRVFPPEPKNPAPRPAEQPATL